MMNRPDQILLITENPDLIQAVRVILKGQYEVIADRNWDKEKELLNTAICIMVDLSAIGGLPLDELMEIIAKAERPVIAIIDSNDIQARKEAMNIGIYDYIDIPLDADRVVMSVRRVVA